MTRKFMVIAGACICGPQKEILKSGDEKEESFFLPDQLNDLLGRGFLKEVENTTEEPVSNPPAGEGGAGDNTPAGDPPKDPNTGEGNPPAGEGSEGGDPPKDPNTGEGNPPAGEGCEGGDPPAGEPGAAELEALTKKELESMLTEKNIAFKPNSNKAELIALLTAK